MSSAAPDSERELLRSYLVGQRQHVLGILEGLNEVDLRRPVLPSGWTCLGLINHLAIDVEMFWFRAVVAGEQGAIDELAGALEEAWHVGPDVPVKTVFAQYRQAIERSDAIIANASLDAAPAWWPVEQFGDFRMDSVRQIILHVMTETASHSGHADIVRELIDGRQWLVLTD